ncbi:MAG TPA: hypothetical protein VK929_14785 [Longimicrobiales bacterium]|nr:hypothetical protein [Longimicrobiales bacterium]
MREALERRFPDALPLGHGRTVVASGTGIGALDALLPGGGLPRGRLTLWQPGGGATAVLRSACEAAVARGERAAWIDGAHLQGGDFWRAGPLLVRPGTPLHALEAAETLLDSGGLSVLIVQGCAREAIREAVRLTRAARTGGCALVLVAEGTAVAHLRAQTRLSPDAYRWRTNAFGEPVEPLAVRLEMMASSMGWSGRTSFELPVRTYHLRHFPEPRLPDRRGWRRPRQQRRPA